MTELQAFMKSNKVRRAKIASSKGFKSSEDYIKFLQGNVMDEFTANVSPTIHNVYILDASGSMSGGKFNNALLGINGEIAELKKDKSVNYTQTIVDFSGYNDVQRRCTFTPIKSVRPYTASTRGMTALYQAVGETLNRLSPLVKNGEKVLVKIFTDGMENNSRGIYSNPYILSQLIKNCESNGFTITFVGTEFDVQTIIKTIGIDSTNTLVHNNTAQGVADSFNASFLATRVYVSSVKAGEDVKKGFYKKVGKL